MSCNGVIRDQLPKPASSFTTSANASVIQELPFDDTTDYANATRGWLAPFDAMIDKSGNIVTNDPLGAWNMKQYNFLDSLKPQNAPATVNPSLWRIGQLNNKAGLFEVIKDHIYQIRGMDLSVMTLILGNDKGLPCWIVIDPLVSAASAKAGMTLANNTLFPGSPRPVRAVISTHSHIDHMGGILGVTTIDSLNAGIVHYYAPSGFMDHAVNENVTCGTAMGRRATYMYGNLLLNKGSRGQVDAGLGKTTSVGRNNIIAASIGDTISGSATIDSPDSRTICGVKVDFWNTPETEAPTEMMFYFPELEALCASELVTHTMHNVYSLRGAQVRDPLAWSGFISEVIQTYGDSIQVLFASHHWPTWDNANIVPLLQTQRDLYKYLNDQTFRLFNQGYTMIEIGERVKLPGSLAKVWANRPYYGTVNHNVKAIYQKYLGWFDANPAHLHPLPPEEESVKYVEYMGGAASLLQKAQKDFDKGEYRFVATALNHLVFAEPNNKDARFLLADTYEQLGYQAESGPWRDFYLTGAQELRDPERVKLMGAAAKGTSDSIICQLPPADFFQYLAIHINGIKAEGKQYSFNVQVHNDVFVMYGVDSTLSANITLTNGVINAYVDAQDPKAATIALDLSTMNSILNAGGSNGVEIYNGSTAKFSGTDQQKQEWLDLLGMLEKFDQWFNIVLP